MTALVALLMLTGGVAGWMALGHANRPFNGWHPAILATIPAVPAASLVVPLRRVGVVLPLAAPLILIRVHEFTL